MSFNSLSSVCLIALLFISGDAISKNRHLDLLEGEVSLEITQGGTQSCNINLMPFENMIEKAFKTHCKIDVKEGTKKLFKMSIGWSLLEETSQGRSVGQCLGSINIRLGRMYNESIITNDRDSEDVFVRFAGGVTSISHNRRNDSINYIYRNSQGLPNFVKGFCK